MIRMARMTQGRPSGRPRESWPLRGRPDGRAYVRMIDKEPDNARFELGGPLLAPGVHRFAHSAMATIFEIYCAHPDAGYSAQAAQAAFDLVDRLEQELSRFIGNSDISRINGLESGECAQVSPWTLECLQTARRLYFETGKAFDVAIGTGLESLELDSENMIVRSIAGGVRLDLGGIGKGYAVDRMAEVLEEWEINRSLLHGGFSSVIALEPPADSDGWPLTLSRPGPGDGKPLARISSRDQVFSASGVRKGDHIVDPREGRPVQDRVAAWVSLPRRAPQFQEAAAVAEGLSTAFMILSREEIDRCREGRAGLEVWLVTKNGENRSGEHEVLHLPAA